MLHLVTASAHALAVAFISDVYAPAQKKGLQANPLAAPAH